MNLEHLQTLLGAEKVSTSVEDRLVYSRDASRLEGECLAVVWPSHPEQVAALVEWARVEGTDLVPRGAGTGLCSGATPQHSVVVDLSHLTHVGPVDAEQCRVQVGAGVVLGTLNRCLLPHGLFLPVIPGSHQAASIGGMIATNAAGLRAVRYGTMRNWVEEVTLVNGLGRLKRLTGDALDDAVGREGVTGFVVEATVRLAPLPTQRTVSLLAFDEETSLLAQRDRWLSNPSTGSGQASRLTALEYLNRHAAAAIGWAARSHLLAEFDSEGGEITDPARIAALWRARDGLYPVLAQRGYPIIEDPQISNSEGLTALLVWLEAEEIPVFGHLGIGIVHPCFRPGDGRVAVLYERVVGWGGQVSGEHGIGLKKKTWTDEAFRAGVRRLKETYDPQNVINRGKLC